LQRIKELADSMPSDLQSVQETMAGTVLAKPCTEGRDRIAVVFLKSPTGIVMKGTEKNTCSNPQTRGT
jgi:hypothetical protein